MIKALVVILPLAPLACSHIVVDPPPGGLDRPVVPRVAPTDRPGTLRIRVVSPVGGPLPGVDVIATSPGHHQRNAHTDENGMVVFWELHPGIWQVSVSLAGYNTRRAGSVSVEPEDVTPTLITLHPSEAPSTVQPLYKPSPQSPTLRFDGRDRSIVFSGASSARYYDHR